ncbi:hypothetical protein M501DRAFT_997646 [Patellaria atrata CBS 101060]|uniref:Uncharacterized protein n=1 Tax=Patellaria atrata CBS 101060 TaxID=1346257 RepID=A0A9P4VPW9_9PEZI|nr:hypothetical protein M501DRAFT_997646 [Patellaria atrata CBS 101060]
MPLCDEGIAVPKRSGNYYFLMVLYQRTSRTTPGPHGFMIQVMATAILSVPTVSFAFIFPTLMQY